MGVIQFQFPAIGGVHCLFTGRDDNGVGNLSHNAPGAAPARAALMALGAPLGLQAVAECRQVHGVHILPEPPGGDATTEAMPTSQADGMMTSRPGLGLLIKTADCQPILLADRTGQYIMALHCGWRGNRQHFPTLAVRQFCAAYHLPPETVYAVRGPSLGFARFENFDGEWEDSFLPWFDRDTQTMDLWALTTAQLHAAGVPLSHIYGVDICTWLNARHWFSWRKCRDEGRQGALIWIIPRGKAQSMAPASNFNPPGIPL